MIMDAGLLSSPFVMAHEADCSRSESAPFQGERGMPGTHDPLSIPSAQLGLQLCWSLVNGTNEYMICYMIIHGEKAPWAALGPRIGAGSARV